MRASRFALPTVLVSGLLVAACDPAASKAEAPAAPEAEAPTEAAPDEAAPAEQPAAEAAPAAEAPTEPAPAAEAAEPAEVAPDTFVDGVYTSPRFNVRFTLPAGWSRASGGDTGPAGLGTSDDSITFVGPEAGLRLVVANSDSVQLVDASFANLTETIGFDNVRIVPDASQARTFNGIPGYRTEADALLRGDPVPQYIIAQALELPGQPTMFTVFVNGDAYDLHSDAMKAILDSIEVIDARAQ